MTEATLRERIGDVDPAPARPEAIDGLIWRPATVDDVDAIVGLYARMAAVDHPDWTETREEILEEFEHSWVDPARDMRIGFVGDEAVAFGYVIIPPEPESIVRVVLDGGVDPAHRGRGIGRRLFAWEQARGLEALAASDEAMPGWMMSYAEERNPGNSRLAERAGLPLVRWFSKLERDLSGDLPEPAALEGLRIATVRPEDREAVLEAKNAAFRDHWGSQPSSAESWASMWEQSTFVRDLSALAWEGDRVVGFVLVWVTPSDFELQGWVGGYIGLVGTLREHRRRGVAEALLAASMRAAAALGHERIALDVDSKNPSGALGLYTRLGFVATERSVAHVREF